MNIRRKVKTVPLNEIEIGETFYYAGWSYIKTNEVKLPLGYPSGLDGEFINCACLDDGALFGLDDETEVIQIKLEAVKV